MSNSAATAAATTIASTGTSTTRASKSAARTPIDVDRYVEAILAGERTFVARAITLVESTRPDHQELAQALLLQLIPHTGSASRVGITGVPGAGKSTFIDELGVRLTGAGHQVAVLAVDPSSTRNGGSILGDKTRMARLSNDPAAFIRPSPSSGSLGGVTRSTREAMVVVEAAGFDVVIVETVGVGQSETAVANMVDCFVVLMVARTGDSLQGIKRGVLELADVVAVNKADGNHEIEAKRAASELAEALHLLEPVSRNWQPPVLTCSARDGSGIDEVWEQVTRHRAILEPIGELGEKRLRQQTAWMWTMVHNRVLSRIERDPAIGQMVPSLEAGLRDGSTTPTLAAMAILDALDR